MSKSNKEVKKIVIALGGNALQDKSLPPTADSQREVVRKTCDHIAQISKAGYELVIAHGNGPQVGRILLASETSAEVTPVMPVDVCGAMSQGYIGYHLQQAMQISLRERHKEIPVVTLVTQVEVDENDPAFDNPTKPIGPFYTEEEAEKLIDQRGYTMNEDSGRGYRRVVPSPMPQKIVEIDSVKRLWDSTIVITVGGGGIPVIKDKDGDYHGVNAVIDKDLASEVLAEQVGADMLMILTDVEKVAINYGKHDEEFLDTLTLADIEKYKADGQFSPGSMLPKINAVEGFVKSNPDKYAIITSLYKAMDALEGKAGTIIKAE